MGGNVDEGGVVPGGFQEGFRHAPFKALQARHGIRFGADDLISPAVGGQGFGQQRYVDRGRGGGGFTGDKMIASDEQRTETSLRRRAGCDGNRGKGKKEAQKTGGQAQRERDHRASSFHRNSGILFCIILPGRERMNERTVNYPSGRFLPRKESENGNG